MKALFNATCSFCGYFRPRCATIRLRDKGKRMKTCGTSVACEQCREKLRGKYVVDARHTGR